VQLLEFFFRLLSHLAVEISDFWEIGLRKSSTLPVAFRIDWIVGEIGRSDRAIAHEAIRGPTSPTTFELGSSSPT
jgi:hypothetical protein